MAAKAQHYDTESILRTTAEKLRACLEGMETHGDGEHPAVVADIARISTALTTTCAEIRQHAKAAVREVAAIGVDAIVVYLKTLPMDARKEIARDLAGEDDEAPLL